MEKKQAILPLALLLILLNFTGAFSQYRQPSLSADQKIGLGFQTAYPFFGLSIKYKIVDSFSLQSIIGILFDTKLTSLRALYHFSTTESSTAYCFGQIGQYSITGLRIDDDFDFRETTEKIFGYGFGLGLEYHFEEVNYNIPVWANIEVIYGNLNFKEVDFEAQAITIGGGLHYYF